MIESGRLLRDKLDLVTWRPMAHTELSDGRIRILSANGSSDDGQKRSDSLAPSVLWHGGMYESARLEPNGR